MCYQSQILIILLLALNISYEAIAQDNLTVSGEIDGLEPSTVSLYLVQGNIHQLVDSSFPREGKFSFSRKVNEPQMFFIKLGSATDSILFVWDNDIQISGNTDSIGTSTISGSEDTDHWISYREKHIDFQRSKLKELAITKLEAMWKV